MVTYDELKKISSLAKLSLGGVDTDALAQDISNILEFANTIAAAPVSVNENEAALEPWPLRKDEVVPSVENELILQNAGEKRAGCFVARRMGGPLGE